jgi:ribosomal protein L37AE/L43A
MSNDSKYTRLETDPERCDFCSQCKIYTPVSRLKNVDGAWVCDACLAGENGFLK